MVRRRPSRDHRVARVPRAASFPQRRGQCSQQEEVPAPPPDHAVFGRQFARLGQRAPHLMNHTRRTPACDGSRQTDTPSLTVLSAVGQLVTRAGTRSARHSSILGQYDTVADLDSAHQSRPAAVDDDAPNHPAAMEGAAYWPAATDAAKRPQPWKHLRCKRGPLALVHEDHPPHSRDHPRYSECSVKFSGVSIEVVR